MISILFYQGQRPCPNIQNLPTRPRYSFFEVIVNPWAGPRTIGKVTRRTSEILRLHEGPVFHAGAAGDGKHSRGKGGATKAGAMLGEVISRLSDFSWIDFFQDAACGAGIQFWAKPLSSASCVLLERFPRRLESRFSPSRHICNWYRQWSFVRTECMLLSGVNRFPSPDQARRARQGLLRCDGRC